MGRDRVEERVVEFSGLSAHCDFVEQVYTEGEDSVLKPDMIINLPGNSHVVVDSKLPLDAYLQALETDDETSRNLLFAKHAKDLRDHVNRLAKNNTGLNSRILLTLLYCTWRLNLH